jgi:hypothetical protein
MNILAYQDPGDGLWRCRLYDPLTHKEKHKVGKAAELEDAIAQAVDYIREHYPARGPGEVEVWPALFTGLAKNNPGAYKEGL